MGYLIGWRARRSGKGERGKREGKIETETDKQRMTETEKMHKYKYRDVPGLNATTKGIKIQKVHFYCSIIAFSVKID